MFGSAGTGPTRRRGGIAALVKRANDRGVYYMFPGGGVEG